jgi:hypothetical protein
VGRLVGRKVGEIVSYANAVRAAVGASALTDSLVASAQAIEAAGDRQAFDEALITSNLYEAASPIAR